MLAVVSSAQTEFLVIELKQQLATIYSSLFITSHSAQKLRIFFDEDLIFCDQILSVSKC